MNEDILRFLPKSKHRKNKTTTKMALKLAALLAISTLLSGKRQILIFQDIHLCFESPRSASVLRITFLEAVLNQEDQRPLWESSITLFRSFWSLFFMLLQFLHIVKSLPNLWPPIWSLMDTQSWSTYSLCFEGKKIKQRCCFKMLQFLRSVKKCISFYIFRVFISAQVTFLNVPILSDPSPCSPILSV